MSLISLLESIAEIFKFIARSFHLPSGQIKKVVNIYDSLHRVINQTSVERILVYKAHNGGGVIKPDTPLYSTVLYEDYEAPLPSVKDQYQKLELPENAIRLLLSTCLEKKVKVKVEQLEQGIMRDLYEGDGVAYTEIFYLGQGKKAVYFCSVATSKESWENDAYQNSIINIAVNAIKNNIR